MKLALLLVVGLAGIFAVGCSAAQALSPSERVKLGIVGLRVACLEALKDKAVEPDVAEACEHFVLPDRIEPDASVVPVPSGGAPAAMVAPDGGSGR